MPGPYTLVLQNPARRFRWLSVARADTIGVRVPELRGPAAELLRRVGAVAATSANLHEGPDPRRLDDVPEELRAACAALVDGGELPGTASTVLDCTASPPVVLREGAVPAADALELVRATLASGPRPLRDHPTALDPARVGPAQGGKPAPAPGGGSTCQPERLADDARDDAPRLLCRARRRGRRR